MSWYYVVGSEQRGPVSEADLDALHRKGDITGDTLVWSQGLDNWKPYNAARRGISSSPGVPAPSGSGLVTCAISGKQVPVDAAIPIEGTWVSAEYKEQALQRIREGLPIGSNLHYAGFWVRFVAIFIDGIITFIISMVTDVFIATVLGLAGLPSETLQIVVAVVNFIAGLCIGAAYEIVLVGRNGATIGKMACGIKVTDPNGKPIGYGKSTGRYFAKMLSGLTLSIGYVMAAFDDEKRALHDRLCETRVIHK